MISLPDVSDLRKTTQSLAVLDLLIEPEWEFRYYSYNKEWAPGQQMASMRNGSGDEWFIWFEQSGKTGIKGLAHESPAANIDGFPESLNSALPQEFSTFANEPAFSWSDTTFVYWHDGTAWHEPDAQSGIETGATEFLSILNATPQDYQKFASEYFERDLDIAQITQIFDHTPISWDFVRTINPEILLDEIQDEIEEIGFPIDH